MHSPELYLQFKFTTVTTCKLCWLPQKDDFCENMWRMCGINTIHHTDIKQILMKYKRVRWTVLDLYVITSLFTVPTQKLVRHLTSSPAAVKKMLRKAELMGIITQVCKLFKMNTDYIESELLSKNLQLWRPSHGKQIFRNLDNYLYTDLNLYITNKWIFPYLESLFEEYISVSTFSFYISHPICFEFDRLGIMLSKMNYSILKYSRCEVEFLCLCTIILYWSYNMKFHPWVLCILNFTMSIDSAKLRLFFNSMVQFSWDVNQQWIWMI